VGERGGWGRVRGGELERGRWGGRKRKRKKEIRSYAGRALGGKRMREWKGE